MNRDEIKRDLSALWLINENSGNDAFKKYKRYVGAFEKLREPLTTIAKLRFLERKSYIEISKFVAYTPQTLRKKVCRIVSILDRMINS